MEESGLISSLGVESWVVGGEESRVLKKSMLYALNSVIFRYSLLSLRYTRGPHQKSVYLSETYILEISFAKIYKYKSVYLSETSLYLV